MEEGPRRASRFTSGHELGGKYLLVEPIGSGGVGEVWSAVNRTTRGALALKVVAAGTVSPDASARFRHEAALSASLAHRNIVRVYDLLEQPDGTLALVMELLRGETARDRLLRTGLLPTSAAVSIATQISSALSHAHTRGIVHRDIKPPNIYLATEPDGEITPKLLDFGIAKTAACSIHTSHGQLLGTPRYMSPEQIRAEAIDGRSDIFSLGVVLYELLTGRSPFAAGFATASLAAVLESPVPPDPRIPELLWNVLVRAMAKQRDERYASADEFADALRDAIKRREGSLSRILVRSHPPPPIAYDDPIPRQAVVIPKPIADLGSMPSGSMASGSMASGSTGFGSTGFGSTDSGSLEGVPLQRRSRARGAVLAIVALSVLVLGVGFVRSVASRGSDRVMRATPAPLVTAAPRIDPLPSNSTATSEPIAPPPASTPVAPSVTEPVIEPVTDPFTEARITPPASRPFAATFARAASAARPKAATAPALAQKPADVVRDPGF